LNTLQYSKKNIKKMTKGPAFNKGPSAVVGLPSVVDLRRSAVGGLRSVVVFKPTVEK